MDETALSDSFLLTRHWWSLAVRGIIAVIFGILAIVWPGIFAEAFIIVFGIFFLAHGVFILFSAADMKEEGHRGSLVISGIFSILVGLLIFFWPGVTLVMIVWIIAFWALIAGIFEMSAAFQLPGGTSGKVLLFLSGMLSVFIGLILLAHPGAGVMAVLWLIGIYSILAGLTLIGLAFRIRGHS